MNPPPSRPGRLAPERATPPDRPMQEGAQDMEGDARRISYQALAAGVPVRASGGEQIGTVEHVLQVPELDVFDGIVVKT
jgi:hypothetical protein